MWFQLRAVLFNMTLSNIPPPHTHTGKNKISFFRQEKSRAASEHFRDYIHCEKNALKIATTVMLHHSSPTG